MTQYFHQNAWSQATQVWYSPSVDELLLAYVRFDIKPKTWIIESRIGGWSTYTCPSKHDPSFILIEETVDFSLGEGFEI